MPTNNKEIVEGVCPECGKHTKATNLIEGNKECRICLCVFREVIEETFLGYNVQDPKTKLFNFLPATPDCKPTCEGEVEIDVARLVETLGGIYLGNDTYLRDSVVGGQIESIFKACGYIPQPSNTEDMEDE